jgi:hypothetical protein
MMGVSHHALVLPLLAEGVHPGGGSEPNQVLIIYYISILFMYHDITNICIK